MTDAVIAIVGRPNVGKSSLFNRFIGERISIVHDEPGVTRDRIYSSVDWLTKNFRLIDTGGLQLEGQVFQDEIKMQVELAIDEADMIFFVVSAHEGITNDDYYIAGLLRQTNKPVCVLVNKSDNENYIHQIYDFYALGYGEPIAISASHGIGIGDALDWTINHLPIKKSKSTEMGVKFSVIGRPNVGKSSLVNAILNQDRVIVSDIEGTTRDAIDTPFKFDSKDYVIVDTAGIRKRGKVYENIEKYSVLRALSAIEKTDVVLFLLDGSQEISAQDKNVAGLAHEAGKPVIIVVNKYDLVSSDKKTPDFEKTIRNQFQYLSYAPIVYVSAKTRRRVQSLLPQIDFVYENSTRRISTSILNEVIQEASLRTPPPSHRGKQLRIFYASQVSIAPPTFVIFVNDPDLCHFSYKRYLENSLREAFEFEGTPIRILIRKRS